MNWNETNTNPDWNENVPPFSLDEEDPGPYDFSDVDSMEKEPLVHEEEPEYDVALAEEASREYVGQWNRLISRTNWEKGKLIYDWRESMIASHVPNQLYSDEAWSRRVGNVTSQHVGRLRRVYERFGETHDQYDGLFWSHFQAALDWEDAEIWLEGAAQNRWSVSNMRKQRWIAIGAPPELKPSEEDVVLSELDEDVAAGFDSKQLSGITGSANFPSPEQAGRVQADGIVASTARDLNAFASGFGDDPDAGYEDRGQRPPKAGSNDDFKDTDRSPNAVKPAIDTPINPDRAEIEGEMRDSITPKRLFENLPELPSDLDEATEMFKMAIMNHKLDGWKHVHKEDVQAVLAMLIKLCD